MTVAEPALGLSLWPAGRLRYFERLVIYLQPPAWAGDAACRGSGLDPTDDAQADTLVALCETCPVREPCLITGLKNDVLQGVWGGLTTEERDARRRAVPVLARRVEPEYMRAVRAERARRRGAALARRRAKGLRRLG